MLDFLEQLVHGLTLGSMYAMVAAGLALMLGVARLINFAHGEFFMLGAYAFWYATGSWIFRTRWPGCWLPS